MPSLAERREAWRALARVEEVDDVAAKFRLSIGQIADAAEVAVAAARARRAGAAPRRISTSGPAGRRARASESSRRASSLHTPGGPRSPGPPARGPAVDLELPPPPRPRALRSGATSGGCPRPGSEGPVRRRVGHREDDGGRQVIARDLGLELFRIDLATVVSKYIGETEKNLDRIFAAADGLERDPLLRRGRRAVRQALRGQGRARPLRQHRGRLPPAEDGGVSRRGHPGYQLPPEHGRRRSCAGSTS